MTNEKPAKTPTTATTSVDGDQILVHGHGNTGKVVYQSSALSVAEIASMLAAANQVDIAASLRQEVIDLRAELDSYSDQRVSELDPSVATKIRSTLSAIAKNTTGSALAATILKALGGI